jgi:hypothetical protein
VRSAIFLRENLTLYISSKLLKCQKESHKRQKITRLSLLKP